MRVSTANTHPRYPESSRRPFLFFREQAGFSLIELLVVLAIIAITGIIAGLTLLPGRAHNRLLNTSRDLAGDIRLARQLAVARNVDFRIFATKPSATSTRYQIEQCASNNGACTGCVFPPSDTPGINRRNLNVPPPGDEGQYGQYRGVAYTGVAGSLCFAPNGSISVPGALEAGCGAGFIACVTLRLDADSNNTFGNSGDETQTVSVSAAGSVTVGQAQKI
jgi:prepilin-type N-terminal cleavage/methylation domain-containing protein